MEFTVEAGDLAGALSRIGRVVPSRDTLPILNAALLRVTAEHVLVTGSCMDMEATARVACEVIATGEAAVPAQIISRIVGALPKRELITVRLNDDVSATVEHQADELARIRQKMVAGRVGEAIQDLDRVLLDVDPYCKARATAVAVML